MSRVAASGSLLFLSCMLSWSTPLVAPAGAAIEPLVASHEESIVVPSSSPALASSSQTVAQVAQATSAVDEVWTLINKYYIDRTYAGQDWPIIKDKYDALLQKSPDQEVKLVTDMVASLGDRYTRVLDAAQYASIQKYDLIGVGATFMPNADKVIMVGAPPIPGSAAAGVGLQVGDLVRAVNGVPTQGRTAFDIIDQVSENPNAASLTLRIQKATDETGNDLQDYVLARQFQQVKDPVQFKLTEERADGTKVGLVKIAEFNARVKPQLEHALRSLQAAGANAYVLDLRGNGGGAFQSAVEISSFFVNHQVATYVVDSSAAEIPFWTATDRLVLKPSEPVAIWMDKGTASASEVLAGSLHDNCRAVLLGDTSFGKGLIQAVYGLQNGAGLVMTVAKYVTPSHGEIQGVGLQPELPGMVPKAFLPFQYSTDTSTVDFAKVSQRLDMCRVPESLTSTTLASP
jgi:carboxyl-terminal processing protease